LHPSTTLSHGREATSGHLHGSALSNQRLPLRACAGILGSLQEEGCCKPSVIHASVRLLDIALIALTALIALIALTALIALIALMCKHVYIKTQLVVFA